MVLSGACELMNGFVPDICMYALLLRSAFSMGRGKGKLWGVWGGESGWIVS